MTPIMFGPNEDIWQKLTCTWKPPLSLIFLFPVILYQFVLEKDAWLQYPEISGSDSDSNEKPFLTISKNHLSDVISTQIEKCEEILPAFKFSIVFFKLLSTFCAFTCSFCCCCCCCMSSGGCSFPFCTVDCCPWTRTKKTESEN